MLSTSSFGSWSFISTGQADEAARAHAERVRLGDRRLRVDHDRELLLARHRIRVGPVVERPVLARRHEAPVRHGPRPPRAGLVEDDRLVARDEDRTTLIAERLARRSRAAVSPSRELHSTPPSSPEPQPRRERPRRRGRSAAPGVPSTAVPSPTRGVDARSVDGDPHEPRLVGEVDVRAVRDPARPRRPLPVVAAVATASAPRSQMSPSSASTTAQLLAGRGDRRRRESLRRRAGRGRARPRPGCRSAAPSRRRANS